MGKIPHSNDLMYRTVACPIRHFLQHCSQESVERVESCEECFYTGSVVVAVGSLSPQQGTDLKLLVNQRSTDLLSRSAKRWGFRCKSKLYKTVPFITFAFLKFLQSQETAQPSPAAEPGHRPKIGNRHGHDVHGADNILLHSHVVVL